MNDKNMGDKQPINQQKNEGEGNKTAAKEYNRETSAFATSGRVDGKAKEAKKAVDGPEGAELRKAEEKGKSHSHGEDPELRGKATGKHA
jgi:hypothetical protein